MAERPTGETGYATLKWLLALPDFTEGTRMMTRDDRVMLINRGNQLYKPNHRSYMIDWCFCGDEKMPYACNTMILRFRDAMALLIACAPVAN